MLPSLSIIVPIYNVENYLQEALESLSPGQDREIILIDDGSSDQSWKISDSFAKKHPNVHLISGPNRGYGAACNIGLGVASGDYLAIFEPDDVAEPGFYERLLAAAAATGADLIKANGFTAFDESTEQLREAVFSNHIGRKLGRDEALPLWTGHPCIWNGVMRRQTLEDTGVRFVEGPGASFQDAQFQISLYYTIKTVYFIGDPGYRYRLHPQQSVNVADSKVAAVVSNWREELSWLRQKKYDDLSYFIFNVFCQCLTLYSRRLEKPESRRQLLKGIRALTKESGCKSLDFFMATPLQKRLFKTLPLWPLPLVFEKILQGLRGCRGITV